MIRSGSDRTPIRGWPSSASTATRPACRSRTIGRFNTSLPYTSLGRSRATCWAVWEQNASGGVRRKNQAGPLHTALSRYKPFLSDHPAVVTGDFNSNAIWDKPGWRINRMATVDALEGLGLVSACHTVRDELHGRETIPTLYWMDRTKDGPTYHIDYVFLPDRWVDRVKGLSVGTFEGWCGSGLSDHVPIIIDIDL